MTDREDLIVQLHSVGFTHYEARCFIALLENHPATAYEIAKRASVPRANAYSALDNLARKNAVQPVSENPARYVPVDPTIMLRRIAESTNDRCRTLAEELGAIKKPLEVEYVWSIRESAQVHAKIDEMIESATHHIWIKGHNRALLDHTTALKNAAERGASIVIILFGDDDAVKRYSLGHSVTVYLHEGTGTPVGHSDHLFCLTVDFTAGLTSSFREGGYGIYTQNRPVVELMENMIRHEVYLAEIYQRFGTQIEDEFGTMLLSLRERLLPEKHISALRHQLASTKQSSDGTTKRLKRGRARQ